MPGYHCDPVVASLHSGHISSLVWPLCMGAKMFQKVETGELFGLKLCCYFLFVIADCTFTL